jgi:antitoxin component YwqK of YwqJK toxin-antitoxin module
MLTSCRSSFHIGWLIVAFGLLSGCGGGKYDSTEIVKGRDWQGEVTTVKDGGKPVTGTVVKKNAKGDVVEEVQYKDGFPTGKSRQWYDNGQLKYEAEVVYDPQFKRANQIGTAHWWCENGTMKSESVTDKDGKPVGKQQTWTCSGKLLSVNTQPSGEYMQAAELKNGDVVVTEQGNRLAPPQGQNGMFWEGEHKQFTNEGKPLLVETWANGQLNGPYEKWDYQGNPEEKGTYAAGKKVGTWTQYLSGFGTEYDYDESHYMDPKYAGVFMQAAGIPPNVAQNYPLQDYKVDLEKIKYYVSQGLVDLKKRIDLGGQRQQGQEFVSTYWTSPYVRASRGALDLLVELGADPKAADSFGRTRLHYCVISLMGNAACSPEEVQRLLGLGIAADQADQLGVTPLNDLIYNSTTYYQGGVPPERLMAVAKLLVDAGANPDSKNSTGWSALQTAALYKKFDVATLLLEHSKDPAATTKEGLNLVQLAFLSPDKQQFYFKLDDPTKEFIKLAVSKGVDPNQKTGEMGSMKEIALQAGAIDVAQFLTSLQSQ